MSRRVVAGFILIGVILISFLFFKGFQTAGVVNNPTEANEDYNLGENVVEMTSTGFVPETITVSAGETVTFVNRDAVKRWPATDIHPTHTVYPGSDIKNCFGGEAEISSMFDSCRGLEPGETYRFTFTEVGTWDYHDHLNAGFGGTVVVR